MPVCNAGVYFTIMPLLQSASYRHGLATSQQRLSRLFFCLAPFSQNKKLS
jgi:hypothetical protein